MGRDDCQASPTDAVAGTANAVSVDANVVGTSAIAVFLPRCHSDLHRTSSIDPASPYLPVAELAPAVAVDGLPTVADLQAAVGEYAAALAEYAADARFFFFFWEAYLPIKTP